MEIDERKCPNCGHDVLSWDVTCPGCNQVPWDTPAGRRIVKQRRGWQALLEGGPIAALLIGALVLVIIGGLSWMQAARAPANVRQLETWAGRLFGPGAASSPQQREEILNQVTGLLDRDDYVTGLVAAVILVKAGDERVIPWLIEQLDHPQPQVAEVARTYLQLIAGQELGGAQEAWARWWEAHRHEDLMPWDGTGRAGPRLEDLRGFQ